MLKIEQSIDNVLREVYLIDIVPETFSRKR